MPSRLAQQRMTLSDLEWPFHGSSVPSVWERRALKELDANVNALCTSSTLNSTSSRIARYLCCSWASCYTWCSFCKVSVPLHCHWIYAQRAHQQRQKAAKERKDRRRRTDEKCERPWLWLRGLLQPRPPSLSATGPVAERPCCNTIKHPISHRRQCNYFYHNNITVRHHPTDLICFERGSMLTIMLSALIN